MDVLDGSDPRSITFAAERLRAGELVVFPTETVYGLGADATSQSAVELIYAVKGRPSSNPLIIHIAEISDLARVADLSKLSAQSSSWLDRLSSYWPGPLTVVLPRSKIVTASASAGLNSVAVRIPHHPVALNLIREAGVPLVAPSANLSGYVSPTRSAHVLEWGDNRIRCILEGGPCSIGIESTVISLLGEEPILLRPGIITREELVKTLECRILYAESNGSLPQLSPGLSFKHYSPKTPLTIIPIETTELPERIGYLSFDSRPPSFQVHIHKVLSPDRNLEEVAAGLFEGLRELDQLGLDLIISDCCEETGIGTSIMDRLKRAAAK